jgi:3-mercaptopyruvate sulfurtransferase SseA
MRIRFTAQKLLVVFAACLAACTTASPPATNSNTNTNTANRTATNTAATVNTTPANTATPAAAQSNIPHPEIKRISPQESQSLVAKNEAVIVDVRDASAYQAGHVKGALHVTGADLQARLKDLPRDRKIITYCS